MTKGQRTIATLLVLVAALLGGIVIVQTSTPAEAGPAAGGAASGVAGTCPTDVTGDGVVNVLDLIELLLDFGAECPAAKIVGLAVATSSLSPTTVRIWSDGFAEYKVSIKSEPVEPQVWTPLPVNPDAPRSRPIAAAGGDRDLDGAAGGSNVSRLWADGTVDSIRFSENAGVVTVAQAWITEPN